MKAHRFTAVFLGLLALSLLCPAPPVAAGAPSGLQMEAVAAFEGHFKYGEWLPVWVYLENSGADLDTEVRVRVSGSAGTTVFAAQVPLPTGSRKRVPVYVLPNNFSRVLEVQLVDPEGQVLTSQEVQVRPQANFNYMLGFIAPERGALSLISGANFKGQSRPKVLVDVPIGQLPERTEGLTSFDGLVLNDTDTSSLTLAQRRALEAWVRQGGRLVIGGGAGARKSVAGLPESLLPLIPRSEVEVGTLPGLAELGGGQAVRVPGPFLASIGDLNDGRTLAAQDGLPLVRERAVGDGYVDWIALDLATSPFDAWSGTLDFWSELVLAHSAYPVGLPPDMSPRQMRSDQMTYALSNLPSLALPSVIGLSALLGAYIVLVGPVNYIVLRWRKRLHWAWITIPLITLLFSGGAFGLGYAMRGTDLILNKIAIVAPRGDGAALVNAYVGLFSPSRQSYEIEVRGEGLLSSLNPTYDPFGSGGGVPGGDIVFVQGDPGYVRGLAVNQWSMQAFMTEEYWPDFGGVRGELRFEEGALIGTVHNQTGQTLKDVVVVIGNDFTRLGEIEPGGEAGARLAIEEQPGQLFGPPLSYRLFERELSQGGPGGPPRDIQLKQQILDSVLNTGGKFGPASSIAPTGSGGGQGLMLLAWFDQAPPDIRVAGRQPVQKTTALLMAPLDYGLPEQGTVEVPVGFVPARVIQSPMEGGMCGPSGVPAVYIGRGEALFEFVLSENVRDVQIERLMLSVRSEGGWQQVPNSALYNWSSGDWAELREPVFGVNVIGDTADLVSENGLVHVRLEVDNPNAGGCFLLGLGFMGTRLQ